MNFIFLPQEKLKEEAFLEHPVWILYEDPEQEEEIESWGIDVNSAWQSFELSEKDEYYYPFLGEAEPPLVRGTNVYCNIEAESGLILNGVLVGSFAFIIFHKGKSYMFNVNLPDFGQETNKELCQELGINNDQLFPLKFSLVSECFNGKTVKYEKFW